MAYICLQSINFLDRFMRLGSANFPLHVFRFRHQDFRLKLHEFIQFLFVPLSRCLPCLSRPVRL
jgi:hypothetical protein